MQRSTNRTRFLLLGLVVGGLLVPYGGGGAAAARSGAEPDADKTLSPYFFVSGRVEGEESFPLESTRVSATVSGVIANVVVKQTYKNSGTAPLDARYVFPASTRAAVHGMTIRVGSKVVVARIK